jgi:hypothetical protein
MEKFELAPADYEQIKSLVKTAKSILGLYDHLYKLEIEGKSGSEEYTNYLGYLQMAIEVQDKDLAKRHLDGFKIMEMILYLADLNHIDGTYGDLESIIMHEDNKLPIRRVISQLSEIFFEDPNNLKNIIFPNQVLDYINSLSDLNQHITDTFDEGTKMSKDLNDEILMGFLVFLQENIDDKTLNTFKNNLIRTKYNIAYLYDNVEDYFKENSFQITSNVVFNKASNDSFLYKEIRNKYGSHIVEEQMGEMLKISDIAFRDKNNSFSSILRQCYLRSSFLLMNDEDLMNVNSDFHDMVESPTDADIFDNYRISQSMIVQSFKKIKKDREKLNPRTKHL